MSETSISWTAGDDGSPGKTWNPVAGCSIVSPGCHNCYAMKMAARLAAMGQAKYQGLTKDGRWTGKMNTSEKDLTIPLKWKQPKRVFVNSMSDLFHEDVPDAFIDRVFGVMAVAEQHTFQVLTKRAKRMQRYIEEFDAPRFGSAVREFLGKKALLGERNTESIVLDWQEAGGTLKNVWLGVSVEDQKRADERIPKLMETPAAIRFLSCEPLLGPIDFRKVPGFNKCGQAGQDILKNLWVICGGESGPGFRPMELDWARSLRDQCRAARVPFFFKQSSGIRSETGTELDGETIREYPVTSVSPSPRRESLFS